MEKGRKTGAAAGVSARFPLRWLVAAVAVLAGLGVYGAGAAVSPWFDQEAAKRQRLAITMIRENATSLAQEAALADAYWRRYPDVGANEYFGRAGRLGMFGAREHYQRHGRAEGRLWGKDAESSPKPAVD